MWREKKAARRRRGLLVVIITIAATAAIALAVSTTRPTQGLGTTTAADFDHALPVNPYHFLEKGDPQQLTAVLDKAQAAGVESIYSGAVWWHIQRTQSSEYDWETLDLLVDEAHTRGMTVRLQLSGTPEWVHPDLSGQPDIIWYPPVRNDRELEHWSDFVGEVVRRYKGRVTHYEMWNEPNIEEFWKPDPNPADYAALLRAGYLSAKSADPGAKVVFGGLSRSDVGYLDAYYSEAEYPDAASNGYFFDVLGVHPYSSVHSIKPEEPISPDRNTPGAVLDGPYGEIDQNFSGIEKMKATMDEQGDTEKPVYLGEYGFPTTDTAWIERVPDWRRALYLKRSYALARDLSYVEGLSWYAYHPSPSTGPEWTILEDDLDETMTFRALRQVTGAEPERAVVTLSAPEVEVSEAYEVSPIVTDVGSLSYWELYVDGVPQETSYGEVPFDWDTTSVADGTHTLMVAAYPQEGSGQEGSVWNSNVVTVEVDNTAFFGSFLFESLLKVIRDISR